MANAPQNVTLIAPRSIGAPPANAANEPKTVSVKSVVNVVTKLTDSGVAKSAARIGITAPTAKAAADAREA